MKRRQTVFDSAAERAVFQALDSRWSPRLTLYPSLPLAKMIELEPSDNLLERHRRFFYTSNVDYTLCEPSGKPVMSIEFDGIGGGFSRDGTYVPTQETPDRNREWKLNFKLSAARSVGYPLVVISFEEVAELDPDDSLTVLDCLIGRCVAKKREEELIYQFIAEQEDTINELSPPQADEYIQDLVFAAGIEAEVESDPFEGENFRLEQELRRVAGSIEIRRDHLYDPPLPELPAGAGPFDLLVQHGNVIEARAKAMFDADRVGCRVAVKTTHGGVLRTVWIRNVCGDLKIVPFTVAENVAVYVALRAALVVEPALSAH